MEGTLISSPLDQYPVNGHYWCGLKTTESVLKSARSEKKDYNTEKYLTLDYELVEKSNRDVKSL
ncbi:MAG: hypothetical protein ACFFD4_13320 [Candidatus Odinarchaeota archaeon]